ncbi:MAG: L,D-transpeptidase [Verrucomicrobiota bacterium]|nr:MAG: L,D-transpeptidase [Verrucomicrobiota bacterium]
MSFEHHERIQLVCRDLGMTMTPQWLYVSIAQSLMYAYLGKNLEDIFVISTSVYGINSLKNSFGTPLGLHAIADKIGDNAPLNTVFIGRQETGKCAKDFPDWQTKGYVTTRILRLQGLESGKNQGGNVDTYARYIYIHGIPNETKIGTPCTHGCIGMLNREIIYLFKKIKANSLVLIADE